VARGRGDEVAGLHPFATLVAVAFDGRGQPLLCLSGLAEHTNNLIACPLASMLVTQEAESGDPLASGRMTFAGKCVRVAEDGRQAAEEVFLAAHPEAAGYVRFKDFGMWRLEVDEVWWVGGFGRMDWVAADEYARGGSPA
jgi:putative heme iron utilization protein